METDVDDGIEFEVEKPEDLQSKTDDNSAAGIKRQVFRLSVSDSQGIKAEFSGIEYNVVNFTERGVAIRVAEGGSVFAVDEILTSIKLTLADQVFHLRGKVVQVSSDTQGSLVCGLHFFDMDEKTAQGISKFYKQWRKQLFLKTE
jgi:c-di-GMP-binding flagellar brake protein YcgR